MPRDFTQYTTKIPGKQRADSFHYLGIEIDETVEIVRIEGAGFITTFIMKATNDAVIPWIRADGVGATFEQTYQKLNYFSLTNAIEDCKLLEFTSGGTCTVMFTEEIRFQEEASVMATCNTAGPEDIYGLIWYYSPEPLVVSHPKTLG